MATTNTVATLLIRLVGDMKGLDNTFKTAKRELRSLENTFKSASSGIVAANAAIKKSTKSMAESIKNSTKGASQGLNKFSSDYKKSVAKIDSANKSNPPTGGTGFKGVLDKHGANAAVGFGAVAGGIGAAFYKATKQFAEFDVAVKRAGVISGATADQMKRLETSALDLSTTTGLAASEIAEGMATMARMGFETNKILAAMPHVLDATIVSGEKFDTVLNVVESTLAAFNMKGEETQHVVDTLTKATNLSRAKFKSLGEVLKYAAPAAHDLGISLEELSAAAAIMIQNGKQGGIAGRTLRAALQRLSAPTEAAQIELSKLGVTIKDENGNMRNFGTILNELHDGLQGYGNAQKVAALKTIFGMEASSGMLSVVNEAPGKFKEWTEALEKAGGVTKEFADKIKSESISYQIDMLKRTVEKAAIQLGKYLAPSIAKVSNAIKKAVNWFLSLNEGTKKSIVRVLELTAAFASLGFAMSVAGKVAKYVVAPFKFLRGLFGLLNKDASKVTKTLGKNGATGAVTGLATAIRGSLLGALTALASPTGLLVGTFGLLASMFTSAWNDMDKLDKRRKEYDKAKKAFDKKERGSPLAGPIRKEFLSQNGKPKPAKNFWENPLPPKLTEYEKEVERVTTKWNNFKTSVDRLKKAIQSLDKTYGIMTTLGNLADWVGEQYGKASLKVSGFLADVGSAWSDLFSNIMEIIAELPKTIKMPLVEPGTAPRRPSHEIPYTNPKVPGVGNPWGSKFGNMSYNQTVNVYPKHLDPRKYNAQEYWRKTGGIRV
jgi:TP901 family phage tail tape measure protein